MNSASAAVSFFAGVVRCKPRTGSRSAENAGRSPHAARKLENMKPLINHHLGLLSLDRAFMAWKLSFSFFFTSSVIPTRLSFLHQRNHRFHMRQQIELTYY